jgi:hypothetical protein
VSETVFNPGMFQFPPSKVQSHNFTLNGSTISGMEKNALSELYSYMPPVESVIGKQVFNSLAHCKK